MKCSRLICQFRFIKQDPLRASLFDRFWLDQGCNQCPLHGTVLCEASVSPTGREDSILCHRPGWRSMRAAIACRRMSAAIFSGNGALRQLPPAVLLRGEQPFHLGAQLVHLFPAGCSIDDVARYFRVRRGPVPLQQERWRIAVGPCRGPFGTLSPRGAPLAGRERAPEAVSTASESASFTSAL